jgi:glycosyltransferase involved in cell wall biosynthesis
MSTIVSLTPLPVEADSRTFKEATSFARFGHRSIVVEGAPSALDPAGLSFELRSPQASVPLRRRIPRLAARGRRGGAIVANVIDYLMVWQARYLAQTLALAPAADLYWLHAYPQAAAVHRLSRRHRAPFIYDAHDLYFEIGRAFSRPEERVVNLLYLRLEALAAQRASAMVTVSDGIAACQRAHFGREAAVVRNAWDVRLDRPVKKDIRATIGAGDDDVVAVVVGNNKPGLALDALIEAMDGLPESIRLVFVGRGYECLRHSERLHVVPPLPPDRVSSFLASADMGIVAYRPDGANYRHCLPNGMFHVIAAGLPLIYGDLPDMGALCRAHGIGVPVNPLTADRLRESIVRLAREPERRGALRTASLRASGTLNWEGEERALEAVIQKALGGAVA